MRPELDQRRAHADQVVVPGRGMEPRRQLRHGEANAGALHVGVAHAASANEAGAPHLAPDPTIDVPVLYEDADVLVVDKPPGLLTIATERERERTAYRLLRDWVAARRIESARLFIVHRLDRETSGLIVFAKSAVAKERLQAQFAARAVERIYVALVERVVRRAEGTLTSRLIEDRALRVRTTDGRVGREAITRYRVLERRRNTTLLELQLVTGRRAQIRAQLAAAGHPIAGDREYGSRIDPLGRLALHATRLAFVHPRRGRLSFDSPAPATFGHRPG